MPDGDGEVRIEVRIDAIRTELLTTLDRELARIRASVAAIKTQASDGLLAAANVRRDAQAAAALARSLDQAAAAQARLAAISAATEGRLAVTRERAAIQLARDDRNRAARLQDQVAREDRAAQRAIQRERQLADIREQSDRRRRNSESTQRGPDLDGSQRRQEQVVANAAERRRLDNVRRAALRSVFDDNAQTRGRLGQQSNRNLEAAIQGARRLAEAEQAAARAIAARSSARTIALRSVFEGNRATSREIETARGITANRNLEASILRVRRREVQATAAATAAQARHNAALARLPGLFDGAGSAGRRFNGLLSTISRTLISVGSLTAVFGTLRAVAEGVRLGDVFEGAEAQIAGIIASTGRFVDAQGQVLRPADALASAIGLARQQQDGLRRDALATSATYAELLQAFQSAIGPGLAAGISNLDDLREITLGFSQAADAIGLPAIQLPQEIRSVLSGDITRDSRIARVLQIDNADIRAAQEAGTLIELLRTRLEGITVASRLLDTTFARTFSNFRDALGILGSQAFEPLRQSLVTINIALTNALNDGTLTPVLNDIGTGLGNAAIAAARFVASIDTADLRAFGEAAGFVARTVSAVMVPAVSALIDILGVLSNVANAVSDALGGIGGPAVVAPLVLLGAGLLRVGRIASIVVTGFAAARASAVAAGVAFVGAARGMAVLRLGAIALTRSFLPLLVLTAAAQAAYSAFGSSAEDAVDPIAQAETQIAAARVEAERLRTLNIGGILSPLANSAERIADTFSEAADELRKFRDGLDALQEDLGRSAPVQSFNQAVRELAPDVDLSEQRSIQAAAAEQFQRSIDTVGPDGFSAVADGVRVPLSVTREIDAAAQAQGRLADATRQLRDEERRRNTTRVEAITVAAERSTLQLRANVDQLERQAAHEERILAAKRTQTEIDDDLLGVARDRAELAALEEERTRDLNNIELGRSRVRQSGALLPARNAALSALDAFEAERVRAFDADARLLQARIETGELEAAANETKRRADETERIARAEQQVAAVLRNNQRAIRDIFSAQSEISTLRNSTAGTPERARREFEDRRAQLERESAAQARIAFSPGTEAEDRLEALRSSFQITAAILELEEQRTQAARAQSVEIGQQERDLAAILGIRQANTVGRPGTPAREAAVLDAELVAATFERDSQIAQLAELTEGTDEYREALLRLEQQRDVVIRVREERQGVPTTAAGGFGQGLRNFADANTVPANAQRFGQETAQNVSTFLGDSLFAVVANAFNPDANQSLGDTIRGLALSLGQSLLQSLTQALADSAVAGLLSSIPGIAATAKGGIIPALAGGGVVPGANTPHAIRGAPPSDRTLVLGTPGEFMFDRKSSQRIGYSNLFALMRGSLSLRDFSRPMQSLRAGSIQALAAGGIVAASAPARPRGGAGGRDAIQVLPVLVAGAGNVKAMLRNRGLDGALRDRTTMLRVLGRERG